MFTGRLDLEIFKSESGMDSIIKDLQELNSIENIIYTSESPDVLSHYYNMLMEGEEEFNSESAHQGKDSMLKKIAGLKDRVMKSFEESYSGITAIYRTGVGGKINTLKELRNKIANGELIEKENIKNDDLNQYFGLFNMIGYNISNSSDIIKAFGFHENAGLTILNENLSYGKEMYKNIFNADKIASMVKSGKLGKSGTSLTFLNSIKDVEFKKVEFYTGFPTMIFTKNPGILCVSVDDKDKIVIDTDVIKPNPVSIGKIKKDDMLKILDTAIKVLEGSKDYSKKIADLVRPVLPTIVTTYQGGSSVVSNTEIRLTQANIELASLVTKSQRFIDNLMVYAKHLNVTPYYIVKISEHIVKNNFEKKK